MKMFWIIRRRMRNVVVPLIGAGLVAYFGYHALSGERGVIAWWQLKKEIAVAEQTAAQLQAKRERLEHDVALLSPGSLDADMLEERARAVLNMGRPGEQIVFDRAM